MWCRSRVHDRRPQRPGTGRKTVGHPSTIFCRLPCSDCHSLSAAHDSARARADFAPHARTTSPFGMENSTTTSLDSELPELHFGWVPGVSLLLVLLAHKGSGVGVVGFVRLWKLLLPGFGGAHVFVMCGLSGALHCSCSHAGCSCLAPVGALCSAAWFQARAWCGTIAGVGS